MCLFLFVRVCVHVDFVNPSLLVTCNLSRTEIKLHIRVFFLLFFRKVLISTGLLLVSSLAVHGDYLYWVDKDQPQIERANKMDGSDRGTVLTRLAHLVSIVAVHFPTPKVTVVMILEARGSDVIL